MSYEPTNWKTGDIVSSERMNKIEAGIENVSYGSIILQIDNNRLNKTSQELYDAFMSGTRIWYYGELNGSQIQYKLTGVAKLSDTCEYVIEFVFTAVSEYDSNEREVYFRAKSMNDYPEVWQVYWNVYDYPMVEAPTYPDTTT